MDDQQTRLNDASPNTNDMEGRLSGWQSNADEEDNQGQNECDDSKYITDDENEVGQSSSPNRSTRRQNNFSNGPITSAQPMSSLQDTIENDDQGAARPPGNLPQLLNTVSNFQIRSDDYLIDSVPPVLSPQNAQLAALNEANAIAQRMSTNITQIGKAGMRNNRGAYSILQDNMYLGSNIQNIRGKGQHRRNVTELLPMISSKPTSRINEQSNGNMQNNSTVSSLHKEFLMRNQPSKKNANKKHSMLNHSINVGGGHIHDMFLPHRAIDLNVNHSTAKVDKSSIEDIGFGGAYDRRSRYGTTSGQYLQQSLKKPKIDGKAPFQNNNQLISRKKVKSTIGGNMKFITSNVMANNVANVNIKLKNDSQLLKQTQSLFKSPPLQQEKAKQRYDSSSSSGKLAVNMTDSQTTTKKTNLQKSNNRYSSIRTTSAHKKQTCTTHCLVSARNRSNKLKWKEFDHNCNNMRILESNRKIHESRILSGHHPTHHTSKLRKKLVSKVGYGQITGGETDSKVLDIFTERSGGKDLPTGRSGGQRELSTNRSGGKDPFKTTRSGGRDSNSESAQFQTMLDKKMVAPQGMISTDSRNLQETVISKMLSQNQMTPHYSEKNALKALKLGTPQPLDLKKIGVIKDDPLEDSIVFDKNTEHLTGRSNERQPVVPQELKSGIWIGDMHYNSKQAPYIHSNINTISMNGSQDQFDGQQRGGQDVTQDQYSQGLLNKIDSDHDGQVNDKHRRQGKQRNSSQAMNALSSKTPNLARQSNANEDVTHDETRPDHNMIFSETMRGDQPVLSYNADTNNYYSKGRNSSQMHGPSHHRYPAAPQTAAILSSTFNFNKRASIVDFHCQREEILSGRYKGSDLPYVKNEMLKMQLRQNMTGYETTRRRQQRGGGGKNFKSPISINDGGRFDAVEHPNIPILGLMDSKRGSRFPKRTSQPQPIDFSYPKNTLKELRQSSISPENLLKKQIASPSNAIVGNSGRLIYNLSKIQKYQKNVPFGMKDSIWLPNPEKFLAAKVNQSVLQRRQEMNASSKHSNMMSSSLKLDSINQIIPPAEKVEEGILRQSMADPVLQHRPSTLKDLAKKNESSALLLPDINKAQIPARIHEQSQDIQLSSQSALKRESPQMLNKDPSPPPPPPQPIQQKPKRVSHPTYPNPGMQQLAQKREEPTLVNAPVTQPAKKESEPPKSEYQIPESPKESEKKVSEPIEPADEKAKSSKRDSVPNLEQVQAAWEQELQGDIEKPAETAKSKTPSPPPKEPTPSPPMDQLAVAKKQSSIKSEAKEVTPIEEEAVEEPKKKEQPMAVQKEPSEKRKSQMSEREPPDSQHSSIRQSQMKMEVNKTPSELKKEKVQLGNKSARRRQINVDPNENKESEPLNIEIKGAMLSNKKKSSSKTAQKDKSRQDGPSKLSQNVSGKEEKSSKSKSKKGQEELLENNESVRIVSALKRSDQSQKRQKSQSSVRIMLDEKEQKKESKKIDESGSFVVQEDNRVVEEKVASIKAKSNQVSEKSSKKDSSVKVKSEKEVVKKEEKKVEKVKKEEKKVEKAKKEEKKVDKKQEKKVEKKEEKKVEKAVKEEKTAKKAKEDTKSKKKEEAASKGKAAKSAVSRKSNSSDEIINKSIKSEVKADKKSAKSAGKNKEKSEKQQKEKSVGKKSEKSADEKSKKSEKAAGKGKGKKEAKAPVEKPAKGGGKGNQKSILKKGGKGGKGAKVPSVISDAPLSGSLSRSSRESSKSGSRRKSRKPSQETVEEQEIKPSNFWDTGTDPIDFFSTRVLYNKGDSIDSEAKRPSIAKSKDWAKSRCFKLVMELRILPRQDRVQNARILEQIYLNPREIDIFNEDEATYNIHVLKQRYQTQHLNGMPNTDHEFYLYEIDQKARRTIQVLSSFMLLNKNVHKDILDLLRDENLFITTLEKEIQPGIFSNYKDSVGLMTPTVQALQNDLKAQSLVEEDNTDYNPLPLAVNDINKSPLKKSFEKMRIDVDHNNVIKLLTRVKTLYQTLNEIVQILELIVQQREMFTSPDSLLHQMMIDYLENDTRPNNLQRKSSDNTPERVLVKGQQVLQRLSRRISHFLSDHKLYKNFIFLGMNYQKILYKYAKLLAKLLRLHLSSKKSTQYSQFQNPEYNYDGGVIEFGQDKVDLEFKEPIEEYIALFRKVPYFSDETAILPFLNPEYGDSGYDNRFNNEEQFKEKINLKMKNFLAKKMKEATQKILEDKMKQKLPPVTSAHQQQRTSSKMSNVKGNVDMFNIDYEAGSNAAILSSYMAGHGKSQNMDAVAQSLQQVQRARMMTREGERQPRREGEDPNDRFEDAFNEFNAHYEASMIDHQSFKDTQSKIDTIGTVLPFSNKILSSTGENVLSDDKVTVSGQWYGSLRQTHKKPKVLKKASVMIADQSQKANQKQVIQIQKQKHINKKALLDLNSSSFDDDAETMQAAQFKSATYAVPVHFKSKTGAFVLKPDRVDVSKIEQASESQKSLAIVSESQKTADLGHVQGTQGINVGVKGRVKPERDSMENMSGAGKNIFSAGSLHKMDSHQMLDLQQEMRNALGSQNDQNDILSGNHDVLSGDHVPLLADDGIQANGQTIETQEMKDTAYKSQENLDENEKRLSVPQADAIVDQLEGDLSAQMAAIRSNSSAGDTVKK